jgi:two-component system response regulator HydG
VDSVKGKILIVDDDEDTLFLLKTVLMKQGYSVETTVSPTCAIKLFHQQSFDIAIVDYLMPEMTGDKLTLRLHKLDNMVYIIFITGYSEYFDTMELIKGLNSIVLLKPVENSELFPIIEGIMDRKKWITK